MNSHDFAIKSFKTKQKNLFLLSNLKMSLVKDLLQVFQYKESIKYVLARNSSQVLAILKIDFTKLSVAIIIFQGPRNSFQLKV